MTEDEAKTKACFQSANFGGGGGGGGGALRCLASGCMAWRWDNMTNGHSLEYHRRNSRAEAESRHAAYLRENPLTGHCGLAGPER